MDDGKLCRHIFQTKQTREIVCNESVDCLTTALDASWKKKRQKKKRDATLNQVHQCQMYLFMLLFGAEVALKRRLSALTMTLNGEISNSRHRKVLGPGNK